MVLMYPFMMGGNSNEFDISMCFLGGKHKTVHTDADDKLGLTSSGVLLGKKNQYDKLMTNIMCS